jgi:hypothetical protein
MGVTYDAAALISADRGKRRILARHRALLLMRQVPTVPAPVVAQAWRGEVAKRAYRGCWLGTTLSPLTTIKLVVLESSSARRLAPTLSMAQSSREHFAATTWWSVPIPKTSARSPGRLIADWRSRPLDGQHRARPLSVFTDAPRPKASKMHEPRAHCGSSWDRLFGIRVPCAVGQLTHRTERSATT